MKKSATPRFTHRFRNEIAERNVGHSMTEPQQVIPLQMLLEHRAKGIPIPIFNGVFSEQETPDLFKMDFVEIAELREQTTENIELAKEDLHALNLRYEQLKEKETSQEVVPKEQPPKEQ